jgi:hypothetical protein
VISLRRASTEDVTRFMVNRRVGVEGRRDRQRRSGVDRDPRPHLPAIVGKNARHVLFR